MSRMSLPYRLLAMELYTLEPGSTCRMTHLLHSTNGKCPRVPLDVLAQLILSTLTRLGFNASSFQFAQDIPLTAYDYVTGAGGAFDESLIEATETNATIFLTVYPTTTLDLINSTDLTALGEQILTYQSAPYNRSVMLRYAPEMQGSWMVYGLAPTSFVAGELV